MASRIARVFAQNADEATAADASLIEAYWDAIAPAAWLNYVQHGRGLVVLVEDGGLLAMAYIPRQQLMERCLGDEQELEELVKCYNPRTEVLVLVRRKHDHIFRIAHPVTPPAMYEIVNGLPLAIAA